MVADNAMLYNSVSLMPLSNWFEPDAVAAFDACLLGCVGWCDGQYFHCSFPTVIPEQSLHINTLELLTLMVAFKVWGLQW